MTKTEKYLESNLLLAKFMGAKATEFANFWIPIWGIVGDDTLETGKGRIMEYHQSWDWLMPVVEKIENCGYSVKITYKFCKIQTEDELFLLSKKIGNTKMEATYNACVEFVKKYNTI